jgi:amidase
MSGSELIRETACEVVDLLAVGEVSPLDLLDALEARIAAVDGAVNALPTLCFERARRHAREIMDRPPEARGLLRGLPVAIKDLDEVAGVRTTHGSPIFADHVPEASEVVVEVLEAQGGVVYAKSNTPEFGAGGHTFNPVLGTTRNPWDLARSAAGSSGGAAAALASGTAWLAQGSDMGGSLRSPASFCGVVGLRPTPGRVARGPSDRPFQTLSVKGPMARDVRDTALMLDAMAGRHPADPLSRPAPAESFLSAAEARHRPVRAAYSRDLGVTPVEAEVAAVTEAAARRLEEAGVVVEEAGPDLGEAHEGFQVLRALDFAVSLGEHYEHARGLLKPEIVWNIEQGLALTADRIIAAEAGRGRLYHRMRAFFEDYDLLLTPATIVRPFPVEERYVEACEGQAFETYIDWLAIAFAVTVTACPALSLPCGFTRDHLPVGLQMVCRPGGEAELLSAAAVLEDILALAGTTPIEPRGG